MFHSIGMEDSPQLAAGFFNELIAILDCGAGAAGRIIWRLDFVRGAANAVEVA
jgi:hypothetical protein